MYGRTWSPPDCNALVLKPFQPLLIHLGFRCRVFCDSSCSGGSHHAQPVIFRYPQPVSQAL